MTTTTKPTIKSLTARLDKAGELFVAMQARIDALEAQDTKTRKQLWYLQKVAHGEFAIGTPAKQAA